MNPLTNTLTIVFTINDHQAFEFERLRLLAMFKRDLNPDYSITALSLGHEIRRAELLEQAAELRDWSLIDEILGLIDPSNAKIIDGELLK